MSKFVSIGYGDREGYDRTPKAIRDAAHEHDASLKKTGVLMGIAGSPVQVRNSLNTGVEKTEGAFLVSRLPVAGFSVFDAASLEEAIEMVSKSPCAVAHGVVEVWPLQDAAS